jgi:hypothetical protein
VSGVINLYNLFIYLQYYYIISLYDVGAVERTLQDYSQGAIEICAKAPIHRFYRHHQGVQVYSMKVLIRSQYLCRIPPPAASAASRGRHRGQQSPRAPLSRAGGPVRKALGQALLRETRLWHPWFRVRCDASPRIPVAPSCCTTWIVVQQPRSHAATQPACSMHAAGQPAAGRPAARSATAGWVFWEWRGAAAADDAGGHPPFFFLLGHRALRS